MKPLKYRLCLSILIWLFFITISPKPSEGLQLSEYPSALSTVVNVIESSPRYISKSENANESPSLISGLIKQQLVTTPDAGAAIGQVSVSYKALNNGERTYWDFFSGSGRPLYPADGYNTGIYDPIQIIIAQFFSDEIITALGAVSMIYHLLLIIVLVNLFFHIGAKNSAPVALGVGFFLSNYHLHYAPNNLIYLGPHLALATFVLAYLVLQKNPRSISTTLGFSVALGLMLLNFASLSMIPIMFTYLCISITFGTQTVLGVRKRGHISISIVLATSILFALPHILAVREISASSTNPTMPYLGQSLGFLSAINRVLDSIPYGQFILPMAMALIILMLLMREKTTSMRVKLAPYMFPITLAVISISGYAGIFDALSLRLGLNIQTVNSFAPIASLFASILAALSWQKAISIFSTNEEADGISLSHWRLSKRNINAALTVCLIGLAILFSPFNSWRLPINNEMELSLWIRSSLYLMLGIIVALLILKGFAWKKWDKQVSHLLAWVPIASMILFVPISYQFYGVVFQSTDTDIEKVSSQVTSVSEESENFRFVAMHQSIDGYPSALTYESSNEFIYYPSMAPLYEIHEASGGLSLNNKNYSDFVDSINLGVGPDDPSHPGSDQFIEKAKQIARGEVAPTELDSITIQNKRNNILIWKINSTLYKYAAIKYLFSNYPLPASSYYFQVNEFRDLVTLGRDLTPFVYSDSYFVYEMRDSLPRIYCARDVMHVEQGSPSETINKLIEGESKNLLFVERSSEERWNFSVDENSSCGVDNIKELTNTLAFDVRSNSDRIISIADRYEIGWSAYIDGRKVPVLRANSSFMAIEVPKGEHRVIFKFEPWWDKVISFIVFPSLIATAVVAFVFRNRKI